MEDNNKAEEDNRKESSSSNNIAIDKEPPSSDNTQQDVDPAKFPIMHRYRIPVNCTIMIYTLIQELSKLHGGKHIDFSHGSNRHVLLLQVPTSSNRYQFNRLVVEDDNFLNRMLSFIPNGSNNNECTAVEWVLHALFNKYEDDFVSVAIKKGVAILEDKVMDAETISVMLEDCNISLTNSQKLFCHL